jgi:hypothetical protein
MADHAEHVTDHVQDDTTMVQDVEAWLRYEAQLALESELQHTAATTASRHETIQIQKHGEEESLARLRRW